MPSHLRLQSSFEEPISAHAIHQISPSPPPPAKKQKMSLTQTYLVASTARSKLGREASRGDHNLRRLVGHANLLDTLMIELADAEKDQEAWFNQSVRKASKPEEPKHIQWIDAIDVDSESDDDSDADSESDFYDEDAEQYTVPARRVRSPPVTFSSVELSEDMDVDSDDDAEYDEDYEDGLALTRVASNVHSPPELLHDSDSDSEDDSMPSSPEDTSMELDDKERQSLMATSFYTGKSQQALQDHYLPQQQQQHQQQQSAPMIAAC
ncbi:hypothetical protein MBLNU230_g8201t1 [Neophaeotheca triangularis]